MAQITREAYEQALAQQRNTMSPGKVIYEDGLDRREAEGWISLLSRPGWVCVIADVNLCSGEQASKFIPTARVIHIEFNPEPDFPEVVG